MLSWCSQALSLKPPQSKPPFLTMFLVPGLRLKPLIEPEALVMNFDRANHRLPSVRHWARAASLNCLEVFPVSKGGGPNDAARRAVQRHRGEGETERNQRWIPSCLTSIPKSQRPKPDAPNQPTPRLTKQKPSDFILKPSCRQSQRSFIPQPLLPKLPRQSSKQEGCTSRTQNLLTYFRSNPLALQPLSPKPGFS